MPNLVLYYDYMITLCEAAGDYVRIHALYMDLKHADPISPDTIKTIAKYYDGDTEILARSHKKVTSKASSAWQSVKEILKNEGRCDDATAKTFGQQLAKTNEDCDFRKKVRDWSRAELRKIQNGKTPVFYDFGDLLARYEKLLLRRQQKK